VRHSKTSAWTARSFDCAVEKLDCAVGVVAPAAAEPGQARQRVRPQRPGIEPVDGVAHQHAGVGRVAAFERVLRLCQQALHARPGRQALGESGQLGRGVGRAPGERQPCRAIELARDVLVRPGGGQREVPCVLLAVRHDACQARVQPPALRGRGLLVGHERQQRVREPHRVAVHPHDSRVHRRPQIGLGGRTEQVEPGVAQRGGGEQRPPRPRGQPREPLVDEIPQRAGQRQHVGRFDPPRVEQPPDLEREQRIPAASFVQPCQRRPRQVDVEPRPQEPADRRCVHRPDA
jgi:hypothetical protein